MAHAGIANRIWLNTSGVGVAMAAMMTIPQDGVPQQESRRSDPEPRQQEDRNRDFESQSYSQCCVDEEAKVFGNRKNLVVRLADRRSFLQRPGAIQTQSR
jgi:hypothetical protein